MSCMLYLCSRFRATNEYLEEGKIRKIKTVYWANLFKSDEYVHLSIDYVGNIQLNHWFKETYIFIVSEGCLVLKNAF